MARGLVPGRRTDTGMGDLSAVYQQFASTDPVVNGMAGNWSDHCEKLRGTIRKLDGYMIMAASRPSRRIEIPRPAGS
jgi:hypothetical protein